MSPPDEAEAEGVDGPARVRPYALVRGRTRAVGAPTLPVETIVVRSDAGVQSRLPLERGAILQCCATPTSVAELSAHLHVPVGVARVLVSDLAGAGLVHLHLPLVDATDGAPPEREVLERCLAGLQAL